MRLGFSDPLAHRIEAGCDMFVMASRYEPCGLNQLYSLKYGSVPVVHHTGGLADTITDATPQTLANGSGQRLLVLQLRQSDQLEDALHRACHMYEHEPDQWRRLVETGMNQDWSWNRSAHATSNCMPPSWPRDAGD